MKSYGAKGLLPDFPRKELFPSFCEPSSCRLIRLSPQTANIACTDWNIEIVEELALSR